jgi:hypothetical protein
MVQFGKRQIHFTIAIGKDAQTGDLARQQRRLRVAIVLPYAQQNQESAPNLSDNLTIYGDACLAHTLQDCFHEVSPDLDFGNNFQSLRYHLQPIRARLSSAQVFVRQKQEVSVVMRGQQRFCTGPNMNNEETVSHNARHAQEKRVFLWQDDWASMQVEEFAARGNAEVACAGNLGMNQ